MGAETRPRYRLDRSRRLQSRLDFTRLKAQGRRLVVGALIANWAARPSGRVSRLGVVTQRRLGDAVVRSRARRLMREVFRRHQHDFPRPIDLVLVARATLAEQSFAAVERDFLNFLHRAGLKKSGA